jgi:ABC-2 type transport system permease protein
VKLKTVRIILRREFASYFATPLAYVILVFFLFFANLLAFVFGRLFERGQADLAPFFAYLPWLYLFLAPAIAMRLWAEEHRSGNIELLLTQPVTLWQAVLGKYFAAWLFIGFALALTFPVWITVNYLGSPDNGAIFAAYVGSFFYAGGFLAVGTFTSSITKNQLIAFLLGLILCFALLIIGFPASTNWLDSWAPQWLTSGVASLSFYTHFENITKGVLDLRDVLYFALVSVFFLLASTVVLESRKSA